MKKRVLSFLLVIIMAIGFLPTVALASGNTYGDLTYEIYNGEVTITGCDSNTTSVDIPSEIDGYLVTSIGDYAFFLKILTSITIPDSVTSIGGYAFSRCRGLKSITIPNSVTSIGEWAFSYCSSLTSITIPDSVTSISDGAFSYCSSLASITIPNSVTSIGGYAFSYCSSLTSITIPDSVTSIDGGAFSDCSRLTSITIPDSVTSIGASAFWYCSSLTSISLPESVTSIGGHAFQGCSNLKKVYISSIESWLKIDFGSSEANPLCNGADLYLNNTLVTKVVVPDGITKIKAYAFSDFSSLTSITIPNSVTSIGNYAFFKCSSLTSITIPEGVTSIGDGAFYDCSNLTSITIPDSVTSIGEKAFYNCASLNDVYYEGAKEDFAKIKIYDGNTNLKFANIHYAEPSPQPQPQPTPQPQPQPTPVEKPIYNTSQIFTDVAKDWYTQYVDYAYSYGIFKGNENGTFKPLNNITRAEFVQVLANITGVDTSNKQITTKFNDVVAGDWFAPAVKWANDNGIVAGKYANQFAPEENITREQMCVMIVNYAKFKGITLNVVESKEAFVDDSAISSWAKDAVYVCQMADIVNGKGEGRFDPQGTGLRAEACVIFTKFHQGYLN